MQYLKLLSSSGRMRFLPLTLIRITFGLFYFTSGFNKVFVASNKAMMLETLIDAGIPYPTIMAVFVAICETVFGFLLALGLLTRLSGLVLMTISLVALLTVGLCQIPPGVNFISWYSWLLYLPEFSYTTICLLLISLGCGPFGLDRLILNFGQHSRLKTQERY